MTQIFLTVNNCWLNIWETFVDLHLVYHIFRMVIDVVIKYLLMWFKISTDWTAIIPPNNYQLHYIPD